MFGPQPAPLKAAGHVPNFTADGGSFTAARAKSTAFADGPAAKASYNREKTALLARGYTPRMAESSIQYHTPNYFSEDNKSFITNTIDEGFHGSPNFAAKAASKLHGISNTRDFYNHGIGTPTFYAAPDLPENVTLDPKHKSSSEAIFKHEDKHIEESKGRYSVAASRADYEIGVTGGSVALLPGALEPIKDDPGATIIKMEQVRGAALAPDHPSKQDQIIAEQASANIQVAYAQLNAQQKAKYFQEIESAKQVKKLSPEEIKRKTKEAEKDKDPVLTSRIQKKANFHNSTYVPNFADERMGHLIKPRPGTKQMHLELLWIRLIAL